MFRQQCVPAESRHHQYEFAWPESPAPQMSSPALPCRLSLVKAEHANQDPTPPDDRPASAAPTAKPVAPVVAAWDFRSSFPSPLTDVIDAGILDANDDDPEAIRAIHEEQASGCLALLQELDAIEEARRNGTDPRTGKKPRTEKSRHRLGQYLDAAPPAIISQFDDALAAYENAFGPEAAEAFRTVLLAWHRGVPVNSSSPEGLSASAEIPSASPIIARNDETDILGGPMLPVATPLDTAVNQGVFGQDEDGNPVIPTAEEIEAITFHHADHMMDLLDNLHAANAALAQASGQQRPPLVRAKDRAMSAYQLALQVFVEDFGEHAARRLDGWVHHQVETQRREVHYDPGHPWHYLYRGDGQKPVPVDGIRPGPREMKPSTTRLPRDRAKRLKKLRDMRAERQARLEADRRRYVQLVEMGAAALSEFDRSIAHGGDEELAWASAVALVYTHIRNGLGWLAWAEQQLGELLDPGQDACMA